MKKRSIRYVHFAVLALLLMESLCQNVGGALELEVDREMWAYTYLVLQECIHFKFEQFVKENGCSVRKPVVYMYHVLNVSGLQIRIVFLFSRMPISLQNPMFDHLLESSRRDDSNKLTNMEFGQ